MKLAICVTIKNRSVLDVNPEDSFQHLKHVKNKILPSEQFTIKPLFTDHQTIVLPLFPKYIQSLVRLKKEEDDWILIVVDYQSTDIDMKELLEYECGTKLPWHLETMKDYPFFDRGGGLAKAAVIADEQYKADIVFFCDADLMFARREVIDRAMEVSSQGKFYYPIFFAFMNPEHSSGFWRDTSFGNFACRLEDYKKTEGWYHNISWGWEDRALADSIPPQLKERESVQGFLHQWHPMEWDFRVKEYPVKDYLFKDAACKDLPDEYTK